MAYTKYEKNSWKTGDVVSSVKLNHMEDGIAAASEGGSTDLIRQGVDDDGNPVEGATVIGGEENVASGIYSHAEGDGTTASGSNSHAEGAYTTASEENSHAEGAGAIASGLGSHAEGYSTTASGECSHAEGNRTTASGDYSHAEGKGTIAAGYWQHVSGKYNIEDTNGEYLVIVGNGTGTSNRSNAVAIKDDGSLVLAGGVTFTPSDLQALYNLIHPTT